MLSARIIWVKILVDEIPSIWKREKGERGGIDRKIDNLWGNIGDRDV